MVYYEMIDKYLADKVMKMSSWFDLRPKGFNTALCTLSISSRKHCSLAKSELEATSELKVLPIQQLMSPELKIL